MSMFCYQCQETVKNTGCTIRGVCGKNEEVAKLQDLLIYTLKGISEIVVRGKVDVSTLGETNHEMLSSLFMTITNANFDDRKFEDQIRKMIALRDALRNSVDINDFHDAATFALNAGESLLEKASSVGVLSTENEDVRSLREIVIYGLKGMAAYTEHAKNIGKEDMSVNAFIYEALAATLDDSLTVDG
ncbi:MAG: hydroxylamine reductase, partial [Eubacteriales bacterium]|nr:hydroxylamine reductase [Eubacteriales bacterium]